MSSNSAAKKSLKARQAREQRSYIKNLLRTALQGIEDIPENRGTDFLITTLVNHALQWKEAYYNNSSSTTTIVADQEEELRRNHVKQQMLDVLQDIEGIPQDIDFDSLVSILVDFSKYWKTFYYTQQQQNYINYSIVEENYEVQTDEHQPNDQTHENTNVDSFLSLLNEDNPCSSNDQTDNSLSNLNVESFLRLLNEDNPYLSNDQTENSSNSNGIPSPLNASNEVYNNVDSNQNITKDTTISQETNNQNTSRDEETSQEDVSKNSESSRQMNSEEIYTFHQEYLQIQTPLEDNKSPDNDITTTENIVYAQSVFIKSRKRRYTRDKSKHVCNPSKKEKRFKKSVQIILSELGDIL